MTRLSVNINKIATLRNARGGNTPHLVTAAIDCQRFGAQGITVHPRPDERHIKYSDVFDLRPVVHTEFNIEGYPTKRFMDLVLEVMPEQVTLVPDKPEAITSNAGWNVLKNRTLLSEIIQTFHSKNIRTSLFIGTEPEQIEAAAACGSKRIELYTEPYAEHFTKDKHQAIQPFISAARVAKSCGLGINAGHDLSLVNLAFLKNQIPELDEVSIGHALISDSLYLGLENTIRLYLRALQ